MGHYESLLRRLLGVMITIGLWKICYDLYSSPKMRKLPLGLLVLSVVLALILGIMRLG